MRPESHLYSSGVVFAALMPHAPVLVPELSGSRLEQASATATAMSDLARRLLSRQPETLVVISPHSPRRSLAFGIWSDEQLRGGLEEFGAGFDPLRLPADTALNRELENAAAAGQIPTWQIHHEGLDHGAVVPLWFLFEAGWRGPTVVLGLNGSDQSRLVAFGESLAAVAQKLHRRIAVLASGDMSHRLKFGAPAGYHPRAADFDRAFIELLANGAYRDVASLDTGLRELAAEDVVDSTTLALAAVNWAATGHEVLSYDGPFGVGYAVAVLFDAAPHGPEPLAATRSTASQTTLPVGTGSTGPQTPGLRSGTRWNTSLPHPLTGGELLPCIARQSVAAMLGGLSPEPPAAGTPYLAEAHAVFVTLRDRAGDLRGCVGTLLPQSQSLVAETWRIARKAAQDDFRFAPLTLEELNAVRFEVSVLHRLEGVSSTEELDPHCYGVVVSTPDGRLGILLPNLDGIDQSEVQLARARAKAGIAPWEPISIARFRTDKFAEDGLAP